MAIPLASGSVLGPPGDPLSLRFRGGPRDGQVVHLSSRRCSIGADDRCTLRIRAPGVRAVHCLILHGRNETIIRRWSADTLLNGGAFVDAVLSPGDRVRCGSVELEVVGERDLSGNVNISLTEVLNGDDPYEASRVTEPLAAVRASVPVSLDKARKSLAEERRRWEEEQTQAQERMAEREQAIAGREAFIAEREESNRARERSLAERENALAPREQSLSEREQAIETRENANAELIRTANEQQAAFAEQKATLAARQEQLDKDQVELTWRQSELEREREELRQRTAELEQRFAQLSESTADLDRRRGELDERQAQLDQRQSALDQAAAEEAPTLSPSVAQQPVEPPAEEVVACASSVDVTPQPTPATSSPADPMARLAELRSLAGQDADEEGVGFQPSPSTEAGSPPETDRRLTARQPDEDGESIESYMRSLLSRVGTRKAEPDAAAGVRITPVPTSPVELSEAERANLGANAEHTFDRTARKPAPESSSSLAAMRELANLSTRTALDTAGRRHLAYTAWIKGTLAVMAFVVAVSLALWTGGQTLVGRYGSLAAFVVGAAWSVQVMLLLRRTGACGRTLGEMLDRSKHDGSAPIAKAAPQATTLNLATPPADVTVAAPEPTATS